MTPSWSHRATLWMTDGALLGVFMFVVGLLVTALESAPSPLADLMAHWPPVGRRALMGVWIGATAVGLVRSPLGVRSGAHLNPAVTLTYLALGKIRPADAAGYVIAQFVLGWAGTSLAGMLLGTAFTGPPLHAAATVPGPLGATVAVFAEFAMAAVLMGAVLWSSNQPRWAARTPEIAGALIALFITAEAPLSGASLNPARTVASALTSGVTTGLWVYVVGPLTGMALAATAYVAAAHRPVACCKLCHDSNEPCAHCGHTGPHFPAGSSS